MTNKELLKNRIESLGMKLMSYDNEIDKLTNKSINNICDSILDSNSTDIFFKNRNVWYAAEVAIIDNEVDLYLYTKSEYLDKYGDEYDYKFE